MWQDTVIAISQLLFIPSMIPTLLGRDKPAVVTSVVNAVLVAIIAFTLSTLGLWLSFITATAMSLIWGALAIQKFRMDRFTRFVEAEEKVSSE